PVLREVHGDFRDVPLAHRWNCRISDGPHQGRQPADLIAECILALLPLSGRYARDHVNLLNRQVAFISRASCQVSRYSCQRTHFPSWRSHICAACTSRSWPVTFPLPRHRISTSTVSPSAATRWIS